MGAAAGLGERNGPIRGRERRRVAAVNIQDGKADALSPVGRRRDHAAVTAFVDVVAQLREGRPRPTPRHAWNRGLGPGAQPHPLRILGKLHQHQRKLSRCRRRCRIGRR